MVFILVVVFSLIVYLSIKFHTKKINKRLQNTKSELETNVLNKQYSPEYYTDIGLETIYEDCKEVYSTPIYEIADNARYDVEPKCFNEPEYLTMTEGNVQMFHDRGNSNSNVLSKREDVPEYINYYKNQTENP